MTIYVNSNLCTGCNSCELVCSAHHTGQFNPTLSRIKISNILLEGECKIYVCKNCKNPECVKSCDAGALKQDKLTGVIEWTKKNVRVVITVLTLCPFHAVFIEPLEKKPVICDSCGGDPLCIKFCYKGAIS